MCKLLGERQGLKRTPHSSGRFWLCPGQSAGLAEPKTARIGEKLTCERAAELMVLVGTSEGQRMFPDDPYKEVSFDGRSKFNHSQLIEQYEIKSFVCLTYTYARSLALKNIFINL